MVATFEDESLFHVSILRQRFAPVDGTLASIFVATSPRSIRKRWVDDSGCEPGSDRGADPSEEFKCIVEWHGSIVRQGFTFGNRAKHVVRTRDFGTLAQLRGRVQESSMTVKRLRYIAQVIREQFPQAADELEAIALQVEASAEGRPKRHGNTIFHQLERQAARSLAHPSILPPLSPHDAKELQKRIGGVS